MYASRPMYFAIVKLTFEPETTDPTTDRKDLAALVEKVRQRFKVCAAIHASEADDGATSLVLAALGSQEEKLSQSIDAIAEFCESQGMGRIASEDALMDHIDAVSDYHDEDEAD